MSQYLNVLGIFELFMSKPGASNSSHSCGKSGSHHLNAQLLALANTSEFHKLLFTIYCWEQQDIFMENLEGKIGEDLLVREQTQSS